MKDRENSTLKKALLAAFIGTVIEWYDYFLYGTAAALVFGKLFFPTIEPTAGTMAAFATYAVGFVARPFGGMFFGFIGDKYGRKITLVWTLGLMGGSTFLIGCLPTYGSVGVLAPVLLVLLRCIQGIALGGEWGGAVLMAVEHGHKGRRGFYGSLAQAGVPVGIILGNGIFMLSSTLSEQAFLSWGWRIPFLIGVILTIVGFVIRTHVEETPLFTELKRQNLPEKNPILSVFRSSKKNLLLVVGTRMAENASFYIFTVFILVYATKNLGLSKTEILNGIIVASFFQFFAIIFFGALSDRIGRRAVYLFGATLLTIGIFPFFAALNTKSIELIWLAVIIALSCSHSAMYAPQAAFFSELFGTHVRYSGASFGYQIAAPLAGGVAPIIATYLLAKENGEPWFVATYVAIMGIITIVSVLLAKETSKLDISRE